MAFVNISTTAGESPYGVATASGAVHSIIATTRDARKLVLTTLGVQTAASGDVELLQIPVLGRVIEVLSVEQMQTLSGNPVYISGYKQNPITFTSSVAYFASGAVLTPQLVASVQADQGAASGANVVTITNLNAAMVTQNPYSGYFVFKILTVGV